MPAAVALWLAAAPLAVVALVGAAVGAILALAEQQLGLGAALVGVALMAAALRARLFQAGALARALSGHAPVGFGSAPRRARAAVETARAAEARLVQAVVDAFVATGRRPEIVGLGWGFYLGRRTARVPIFTHNFRGRPDPQRFPLRFYCGTSLHEAVRVLLRERNQTFWSHPTHSRISLGSWLSRSCHGNAGPAGRPSDYAAETVWVLDMQSVETCRRGLQRAAYAAMQRKFDAEPGRYFLVMVEFAAERLADNLWLQQRKVEVPLYENGVSSDLRVWLRDDCVHRVLFLGSARPIGLGVTHTPLRSWEDVEYRRRLLCGPKVRHIDPHGCSVATTSAQLDTCSIVGGWYARSARAWRGVTTLQHANAFSPSTALSWLPLIPLCVLLLPLKNFELLFVLRRSVGGGGRRAREERVQALVNSLLGLFRGPQKLWGRCELRLGDLEAGLAFVDCVLSPRDAPALLRALTPHIHQFTVALHDSKFDSEALRRHVRDAGLLLRTPRVVSAAAQR